MQLEEFDKKIRDIWEKPIDGLENPEFIKYCDSFFETNNDIGYFYYKDQIKIFEINNPSNCLKAFKINNYSGIFIFLSIFLT